MSYLIKSLTLRTDNTESGTAKINEVWRDILSGKLPLLCEAGGEPIPGLSPISRYSNYASDGSGAFDLTIMTVTADFFAGMEQKAADGVCRIYDVEGRDEFDATERAWSQVARDTADGRLCRAFTEDYESSVPGEYTKDGHAHCYLYVAVK